MPRLANIICDGALLAGYGRQAATIDGAIIREVAMDLSLVPAGNGAATGDDAVAPEPRGTRRRWFGLRG